MKYSAYQVSENDGKFVGNICELEKPDLINDHLIIKVKHSSLNYKDALAASGARALLNHILLYLELMLLVRLLSLVLLISLLEKML